MGKSKIRYLSSTFYNEYDSINYPEIEHKESRPYLVYVVKVNDVTFAIPFRTNIRHNSCYKFKNTTRQTDSSTGLDFSKAVVISDEKYLSTAATIDNKEYIELEDRFYFITNRFEQYLEGYRKYVNGSLDQYAAKKYAYTTLKYFHKELSIGE